MFRTMLPLFFLVAAQASAQTIFTVDATPDEPDAFPGDGLCATASGQCTLRAAVGEVAGDPDSVVDFEIRVPPGVYELSRVSGDGIGPGALSAGDLDLLPAQLSAKLTIRGWDGGVPAAQARPVIRAAAGFPRRLVRIVLPAGKTVRLEDLRLEGAAAVPWGQFAADNGAAIHCTTSATNTPGKLELARVALEDNRTQGAGAALAMYGCALVATNVSMRNNCGFAGAVVSNEADGVQVGARQLELRMSSLTGNSAGCLGNPDAQFHAFVVAGLKAAEPWDVLIENVTVGANQGAMIFSAPDAMPSNARNVLMRNVTINGNEASYLGTDSLAAFGDLTVRSGHSALGALPMIVDAGARFVSLGHSRYLAGTGNVVPAPTDGAAGTPAEFGTLEAMPPYTHGYEPRAISVRDAGSAFADDADQFDCASVDQRGAARPAGAACDIGAIESAMLFADGFE